MVLTKNPCDKGSTKCFVLFCNRRLIVLTVKSPDREISVFYDSPYGLNEKVNYNLIAGEMLPVWKENS